VWNVVAQQPADAERAQIVQARRPRQARQGAAVRNERQRNQAVEVCGAVGERLILVLAELDQVAHAILDGLDVAVEHGGVGKDA
jgi:hypothetical protein